MELELARFKLPVTSSDGISLTEPSRPPTKSCLDEWLFVLCAVRSVTNNNLSAQSQWRVLEMRAPVDNGKMRPKENLNDNGLVFVSMVVAEDRVLHNSTYAAQQTPLRCRLYSSKGHTIWTESHKVHLTSCSVLPPPHALRPGSLTIVVASVTRQMKLTCATWNNFSLRSGDSLP